MTSLAIWEGVWWVCTSYMVIVYKNCKMRTENRLLLRFPWPYKEFALTHRPLLRPCYLAARRLLASSAPLSQGLWLQTCRGSPPARLCGTLASSASWRWRGSGSGNSRLKPGPSASAAPSLARCCSAPRSSAVPSQWGSSKDARCGWGPSHCHW